MLNKKTGLVLFQGFLPVVSCVPVKKTGAEVKYFATGKHDLGIEIQSFNKADNTMTGLMVFDRIKSYNGQDLYCSQMAFSEDGDGGYVAGSTYDRPVDGKRDLSCFLRESELKERFAAWLSGDHRDVSFSSKYPYGSRVKCDPVPNPQGLPRSSEAMSCQRIGLYLLDGSTVPLTNEIRLERIGNLTWQPASNGNVKAGMLQNVVLTSIGAGLYKDGTDLFCNTHYSDEQSKAVVNRIANGIGWDFNGPVVCYLTKEAMVSAQNNAAIDIKGTRIQCGKSSQCHKTYNEFDVPSHDCADEYTCTFMEEIRRADSR